MTRRVAARGIIFYKGKLLCFKLKSYNRDNREDYWCTPGGGVDFGESVIDATKRELIEETGIKPKVGNLAFIQQFTEKDTGNEQLEFFFNILNPEEYLKIDLSKTTHGQVEIDEYKFIDPKTEHVLPKFIKNETLDNLESVKPKIFTYLK